MALALHELAGIAPLEDRLTDATQPGARSSVGGDEVAPGRDDPCGIGADLGHVGEHHPLGRAVQALAEPVDLGRADHDQRGSTGLEALLDEGAHRFDELVRARIHQGLVPECLLLAEPPRHRMSHVNTRLRQGPLAGRSRPGDGRAGHGRLIAARNLTSARSPFAPTAASGVLPSPDAAQTRDTRAHVVAAETPLHGFCSTARRSSYSGRRRKARPRGCRTHPSSTRTRGR